MAYGFSFLASSKNSGQRGSVTTMWAPLLASLWTLPPRSAAL
ncbi:MAG TPA: hypothetical protein VKE50_03405 [Thermoanaerobaculia bacterium]|nr:hypothetical protein [Thermoanaerobaculia bacterium]